MFSNLPDGTPDWIWSHCLGLVLTEPPPISRSDASIRNQIRDQAALLRRYAHASCQDELETRLIGLHLMDQRCLVSLDHYASRMDVLDAVYDAGFQAHLAFAGWAFGFEVREGHPLVRSGSEGCFLCKGAIRVGDQVAIMPGPDPHFHPYHASPCLRDQIGLQPTDTAHDPRYSAS